MMIPIQRIVVGTQIFLNRRTSNRLLEHAAERFTIDDSGLNSKSNDPPRVLIHHQQYPMCPQSDRFASKQIETPESVFHVAQERQP